MLGVTKLPYRVASFKRFRCNVLADHSHTRWTLTPLLKLWRDPSWRSVPAHLMCGPTACECLHAADAFAELWMPSISISIVIIQLPWENFPKTLHTTGKSCVYAVGQPAWLKRLRAVGFNFKHYICVFFNSVGLHQNCMFYSLWQRLWVPPLVERHREVSHIQTMMSVPFRISLEHLLKLLSALLSLSFKVCEPFMSSHNVRIGNGFTLCAVDKPSFSSFIDDILGIPAGVPNDVRCAFHCTEKSREPCLAFNVIGSECQFYNSTSNHCFAASTTCVYNQVKLV